MRKRLSDMPVLGFCCNDSLPGAKIVLIESINIKNIIYFLFAAMTFMLTSCSANYKITPEFPSPLVQPIAASVTLNISDEFQSYKYEETRENKNYLSIDLGEAQATLFNTMTEAMFTNEADSQKKLFITPTILDFQYAIPRETRAEIYEIWIKYRVFLQDETESTIADWQITGYGKTPTAFLKSPQEAIQAATLIALRDVGSQLSIGFTRQPDIKLWLDNFPESDIATEQQIEPRQI